jgi:hypothetical protein
MCLKEGKGAYIGVDGDALDFVGECVANVKVECDADCGGEGDDAEDGKEMHGE